MSRYDGLIIPRSYSEYINKTDAATLLQALQLSGVMDAVPTANSNHPVKSGGVAANYGQGKRILFAEGQDLNTIISIGEYYTNTDALANSLVNRPSFSDGKLYGCSMSVHGSTNGKIVQILHTLAGDYLRYTSNNGSLWSEWGKVTTQKVKEVTGITSANGNLQLGIGGERFIVTAVQTFNSEGVNNDAIAIPYKLGDGKPVGESSGRWGVHCMASNSSNTVLANTTMYLTIFYSEI